MDSNAPGPHSAGTSRRRNAVALLALLPLAAVAQDASTVIAWQHDDTEAVAEFRIYYGRAPDALSGVKVVLDPAARSASVDGLADGTWYFAVVAVSPSAVESEPSELYCVSIPGGACDVPSRARSAEPAAAARTANVRVAIGNVHPTNGGFDLKIEGEGLVSIELAGSLLFDWCSPGGISALPSVTPTTPSLGDRDDDGNRRQTVTFTAPIAHTRCDGDVAEGPARPFDGATVTVEGVSKPLEPSDGTWSVQFP